MNFVKHNFTFEQQLATSQHIVHFPVFYHLDTGPAAGLLITLAADSERTQEIINSLIQLNVYRNTSLFFHHFTKGNNLCDLLCSSWEIKKKLEKETTLKGKNLLLWEQILSFKR